MYFTSFCKRRAYSVRLIQTFIPFGVDDEFVVSDKLKKQNTFVSINIVKMRRSFCYWQLSISEKIFQSIPLWLSCFSWGATVFVSISQFQFNIFGLCTCITDWERFSGNTIIIFVFSAKLKRFFKRIFFLVIWLQNSNNKIKSLTVELYLVQF